MKSKGIRRRCLSNVDPGYLNKNGRALMLFETVLILILMLMFSESFVFIFKLLGFEYPIDYNVQQAVISFVILAQIVSFSLGLYRQNLREKFSAIRHRILVSFLVAIIVSFILTEPPAYNWQAFLPVTIAAIITLLTLCYLRFQLLNLTVSHTIKRRVLILGSGSRAFSIEDRTRREVDRRQFIIHAYLKFPKDKPDMIERDEVFVLDMPLEQYVQRHHIEQIVVATDERRDNLPFVDLQKCKARGVSVIDAVRFIENETGQIAIDLVNPDWIIYSEKFAGSNKFNLSCQWLFNCVMAVVIAIPAIPAILLAAIAIKIEDGLRAPVFYSQTRIGNGGKLFDILKLRSMTINAEVNGAQWASLNDTRVTRVGQFIRKYRFDELPQLYNILKGEMVFVGPRPERPEFVEKLSESIPFYNERQHVKPGVTGWAQIQYPYGASDKDSLEKLTYDLYYIKNRSYLFDLFIILQTAETVFYTRGAR